jgi:hypothetical protein
VPFRDSREVANAAQPVGGRLGDELVRPLDEQCREQLCVRDTAKKGKDLPVDTRVLGKKLAAAPSSHCPTDLLEVPRNDRVVRMRGLEELAQSPIDQRRVVAGTLEFTHTFVKAFRGFRKDCGRVARTHHVIGIRRSHRSEGKVQECSEV